MRITSLAILSAGLIAGTTALTSGSADAATLYAGWDTFDSATAPTVSQVGADTTATLTTSANSGNWGRWNGGGANASGASTDGTFGNLSNAVATASTFGAGEGTNSGSNLSLNRASKPGTITITLTNDSGLDRTLDGFYFDATGRFTQSAKDWTLTYSGAISGAAANGTLTEADMMAATPAQRDWAVDLTGLTDNNWEAGSSAIFTLTFSGGAASTGTGGGQETLVDNIGITATAVPEPGSLALMGLGGLLIARRRRD